MLEILGITPVEESVYTVLLDNRPLTAEEVVARCDHPADQVESALAVLEERGLVSRLTEEQPRYSPASPDIGLERLLLARQEELHRSRTTIAELTERFRKVPRPVSALDAVEITSGDAAVQRRLDLALRGTKNELRTLLRPPYRNDLTHVPAVEREMLRAGVNVRAVYDSASAEAHGLPHLREALELGEQARLVGHVPMRLWLMDDDLAMLPLVAGTRPQDGLMLIHPSALLDALSEMFELTWAQATPLRLEPAGVRTAPGPAGPEDPELLGLLAAGLTDSAIARQLGLSVRTVERRISKVMTGLKANTRFQAGVVLGRSGQYDSPDSAAGS